MCKDDDPIKKYYAKSQKDSAKPEFVAQLQTEY